jgi:hypothetical protein
MDEIRDVIKTVLQKISTGCCQDPAKIYECWQKLGNQKDIIHTKVTDFQHGTLFVLVDSVARLYKLNLQREEFLKEIQGHHPEIQRIHFKIGKV